MAEITNNPYVKFLRGTPAAYASLETKDKDTLYFISGTVEEDGNSVKTGKLYLGDTLIAGVTTTDGQEIIDSLAELIDVNLAGVTNGQVLGYNGTTWVPMNFPEAVEYSVMIGAEANKDGVEGLVPAPKAGEEGKFLRGDGTWADVVIPSSTQVFADIIPTEGQSHNDAIAAAVSGKSVQAGDVAVVKVEIASGKYELTAYVYDGANWTALSGNYNAENVYFDEDITITMQVGNATVTNGAGVIPSKGKNLKQVFEALYASEDKTLTIDWPSISFTLTSDASGEVGTTFTRPTATLKVTDIGSYEYGSLDSTGAEKAKEVTGITFNAMKVGFGSDNTSTSSMTNNTAGNYGKNASVSYTATTTDIPSNIITDDDTSYTFYYKTDHTASPYKPRTNLGNLITTGAWKDGNKTQLNGTAVGDISKFDDALGAIEAKSFASTKAFKVTGWRRMFMGTLNSANTNATINSTLIREDMNKLIDAQVSTSAQTFTVPVGATKIIVACPKGYVLSKCEYFTMSWEEIGLFPHLKDADDKDVMVPVADARGGENGLKDYNVYVFTHSSPSGFEADTQYRITLKAG